MSPSQDHLPGDGNPRPDGKEPVVPTQPVGDSAESSLTAIEAPVDPLIKASRLDRLLPRSGAIPVKYHDELLDLLREVRFGQAFFEEGKYDLKAAHEFLSTLGIGTTETGFTARTTEILRVVDKETEARSLADSVLRSLMYDVALKSNHPDREKILNPRYVREQQLRIFAATSEEPEQAAAVRVGFVRGLFTLYHELYEKEATVQAGVSGMCLSMLPEIIFFAGMRRTDHPFSFEKRGPEDKPGLETSIPVWRSRAMKEIGEMFDEVRPLHRDKQTDRFLEGILRSSRDPETLRGVIDQIGPDRLRVARLREWQAWARLIAPLRNLRPGDPAIPDRRWDRQGSALAQDEFRPLAQLLRHIEAQISGARLLKKTEIARRYEEITGNTLKLFREEARRCESAADRKRTARYIGEMLRVELRWGMDLTGMTERKGKHRAAN